MPDSFVFGIGALPYQQEAAVASKILADWQDGSAANLAHLLLSKVDLAPKGFTAKLVEEWHGSDASLAAAVRAIYGPIFAEAAAEADG